MNGGVRIRVRIGHYTVTEALAAVTAVRGAFAIVGAHGVELVRCDTYEEAVHNLVRIAELDRDSSSGE